MLITHTDIYRYSIPMVPFTIATGTMHYAQNLLIRVHTSEGLIGMGECSAFPMIVGETQATCFEMAKDFAACWKNKPALAIEDRLQELDLLTARNYTAKSAFDMALYDLAAQVAGQPLYRYLGGTGKLIESDLTIGIGTPEAMAKTAGEFEAKGVRILKVKLGKKPAEDVERIRQVRAAVSPGMKIRIDANQGWEPEEAIWVLKELGRFDIEFCEQPMRTWNDHFLPLLCRESPIPVMADESVYTHHDAERLIRDNACHSINIKLAKSGGIREALRIHEISALHHIPNMMGGMLESRLALTAKVHLATALDNIQYYDLDTCLLGHLEDPVIGGVTYKGMQMQLPETPGIGADVDPAYLQKLDHTRI